MKFRNTKRLQRRKKGQGLLEYVIIVGFIAIAVYGTIQLIGANIKDKFSKLESAIEGINTDTGAT